MKTTTQVLANHESICQCCNEVYDRTQEAQQVKESGEYICSECWDKE